MKTILKIVVEQEGEFMLPLPKDAEILTMEAQLPPEGALSQVPVIYYLCDPSPEVPLMPRHLLIIPSRRPIPPGNWRYVATAMINAGLISTHLLEDMTTNDE